MSETCPFCGAEEIKTEAWRSFKCGSYRYYEEFSWYRKRRCYEAEIAALTAKLEVWRDLADIVRPMDELKAVKKLEEMGEL